MQYTSRNLQSEKKKKLTEEISKAAKAANTTGRSSEIRSQIRWRARKIVTGFALGETSTWSVESRHQLPPGNISINLLKWSITFKSLSSKTSFELPLWIEYPLTEAEFRGEMCTNLLLEGVKRRPLILVEKLELFLLELIKKKRFWCWNENVKLGWRQQKVAMAMVWFSEVSIQHRHLQQLWILLFLVAECLLLPALLEAPQKC